MMPAKLLSTTSTVALMKKLFFFCAVLGAVFGFSISWAQKPARTGLLSERGLTTADFPQNKKLASNIYIWTDVHPTGLYTTNDLIVITTNGVLVADGQKDPATTKKMVDFIKGLTSQPLR